MGERWMLAGGYGDLFLIRGCGARLGAWGGGVSGFCRAADSRFRFYPTAARFLSVKSRLKL